MTALDWLSILVIVLCLMLSFFFAGSETALMVSAGFCEPPPPGLELLPPQAAI